MFSKIPKTAFPPTEKPIMVWDGECGFCKYWVTNWKSKSKARVEYRTYQEIAEQFQDIPLKEFKKASRLIEPTGKVYSGPDSAYRNFLYFGDTNSPWHKWYTNNKTFNFLSDRAYNFIAKNRSSMFTITKLFFGKNPENIRPYWLFLILMIFTVSFLLFRL